MEGSNVFLTRPAPDQIVEIAHFGSFQPTFEDGSVIPRSVFYLHHILAYDTMSGDFVTGASNERANWGPDHLPYPYRQVLKPGAQVRANGFHMNALTAQSIHFYINYTVTYKVHVPTDPAIRVVRSFYWLDNYNVPGGGERNSTHVRARHNTIPWDMVIVSMNGHLHQGGKRCALPTICTSLTTRASGIVPKSAPTPTTGRRSGARPRATWSCRRAPASACSRSPSTTTRASGAA
jgi:hypothetical protein